MEETEYKNLVKHAVESRKFAYAPYSHFTVGAALLTVGGKIFTGCNIESASFSPTVCAERTAFFKAISEGERKFAAIAIAGAAAGEPVIEICPPCGVCRQVMLEFCSPESFEVVLACGNRWESYLLKELMPLSFGTKQLSGGKQP